MLPVMTTANLSKARSVMQYLLAVFLGLVESLCHTPQPGFAVQGGFVTDTISFTQQQGVATLCFDNPARRNALGAAELDAIEHALGSLSAETSVLVVTSSDDRIFCAGADLSQILDGSQR